MISVRLFRGRKLRIPKVEFVSSISTWYFYQLNEPLGQFGGHSEKHQQGCA